MSISLYHKSEENSSVLATIPEANHIEAQKKTIMMLKEQKTPVEDCLKSVRDLKRCIPNHEEFQPNLKYYYQDLLKGAQTLEIAAVEGDVKIVEAENILNGLFKQIRSLFDMLDIYKSASYQQKFDINQFKIELGKIDNLNESLNKTNGEIKKLEQSLSLKADDGGVIEHFGDELDEVEVQKYLKISKTEQESWKRYNEIEKDLVEVNKELYEKELKAQESKRKVQEIEEKRKTLKKRLQENECSIQNTEANFQTYIQKSEQLRVESNHQFASKLAETQSKNEKYQEKIIERHSKRIDEIEEMNSNLLRGLAQYTNVSPLFHYIFVLDHSGSMHGSRWEALLKALEGFVQKNQDQDADLLSVITFDNSATEMMKKIRFSQYKTPVCSSWGGTNFEPAFEMALEISKLSRTHRPVVIFLTDGDGEIGQGYNILREMYELHKDRGFMFFSIGVGDEFNLEKLQLVTRNANNGRLKIDLGSDTIDFLHKTKEDEFLSKIFLDILDAINALPRKIKASMAALKKEKEADQEEAKHEYAFYAEITKEKRAEISEVQQNLLNREIGVLEKKKSEEEEQIKFLKEKNKEFDDEIQALEGKMKEENRAVVPEEIELLKKRKTDLEQRKEEAWKEKERLFTERNSIMNEVQRNKSHRHVSTTLQLFSLFQSKDKVQSLKFEKRIFLANLRNFLDEIVRESSELSGELRITDTDLSHLEGDGVLDSIFEHYKNTVNLDKDGDIPNFRKIARQILEIRDTDIKNCQTLDLLITSLHPRDFVKPSFSEEDREKIITRSLDKKYKFEIQDLGDQYQKLDDELITLKERLEKTEDDTKALRKEIEEVEDENMPKKVKEIRKLKAKIKKAQTRNEANKENAKTNHQNDSEESDEDYEEKMTVAQEKLSSLKKKFEEGGSKYRDLKELAKQIENQIREIKSEKAKISQKKSEKERERDRMKDKVLEYYELLRIELMARIRKFVKDARTSKIDAFQKKTFDNLIIPIELYFS